MYLLSFPRFWTLSIERFLFLFSSILNGVTLKTSNTRNPFALAGYHWVMLSVLSLFIIILFPVVFCVAFWSSFAYARTILYFFYLYLPLKAILFFLLPHHKKG